MLLKLGLYIKSFGTLYILESDESLNVTVVKIQIYATLFPQREGRGESKSRSPPSPEGISNIKRNPLFVTTRSLESAKNSKPRPSWTIKEYDMQAMHGNLADYLQVMSEKKLWMTDRMNVSLGNRDVHPTQQLWTRSVKTLSMRC